MAPGYPDFEGDKSGLFSQGDWSAVIGEDRTIFGAAPNLVFGALGDATYTVPAGKTFYVSGLSWFSQIWGAADSGKLAQAWVILFNLPDILLVTGGVGGGSLLFVPPKVFEAGDDLDLSVINGCDALCQCGGAVWGWEV